MRSSESGECISRIAKQVLENNERMSSNGHFAQINSRFVFTVGDTRSRSCEWSDAAIAQRAPHSLEDLQGISGMGVKKLEAYAQEVLRVVALSA